MTGGGAAGRPPPCHDPAIPSGPSSGAASADRALIRALAFFRAGAVVEVVSVIALEWRHDRFPAAVLALAGAVTLESAVLVWASWRRGEVRERWVAADVAFLVAGLAVGAVLTAPAGGRTLPYFMYPFTIISCYVIGISYPRLPAVMAITAVLACGYVLSAVAIHRDAAWNVMPNAITYFVNTAVAWAIARELRRGGRSLDASQAEAVSQAENLARERERARHARLLHDHVLQTFESLVRRRTIPDDITYAHVAAEAAWLRALVEGVPIDEPGDLLSRLQRLIQQEAASGLRVEFNSAQLMKAGEIRRRLPPRVADAVVDAVQEALRNVAKHAAVSTAVMCATATEELLTVSVLDHGIGFQLERARRGIGLEKSIVGRVAEIGGQARIETAPGDGTYIELTVPAATWDDADRTAAAGPPPRYQRRRSKL